MHLDTAYALAQAARSIRSFGHMLKPLELLIGLHELVPLEPLLITKDPKALGSSSTREQHSSLAQSLLHRVNRITGGIQRIDSLPLCLILLGNRRRSQSRLWLNLGPL